MQEFSSTLTPLLSPERTMEIVLEALSEVVNYELAVVLSLESDKLLRVRKAQGPLNTPKLRDYRLSLDKHQEIAEIIERGRVHLFEDHPDDGEVHLDTYEDILELPDGHSCLVAPLHVEGNTLGVLTLDHRACDMFTPSVVQLTEILSRLIALALAQSLAADSLLTERDALVLERNTLLKDLPRALEDLIGHSRTWINVLEQVQVVASTDTPVFITGETGTGKEQVAKAVHALSPRSGRPFVALNCSALASGLVESELFGHERGAFTGAVSMRKGRFELANTGTLFLDEIGDLPMEIQPKLLRALQEQTFERVGGEKTLSADVRIICATNVKLDQAIKEGRFREDLYYRLNVFPITLPALRDRDDDVILLANYFLQRLSSKFERQLRLTVSAVEYLRGYTWPGNVRELQNALERAAIVARGDVIDVEHFGPDDRGDKVREFADSEIDIATLEQATRSHILKALRHCNGRIYGDGGTAELLDLKPTTLQSRMKKLGITAKEFKG